MTGPLQFTKIGNVMEVKGVILREGVFVDSQGRKFYYTKEILQQAAPTYVGVPIVYPHTKDEEGVSSVLRKIVGFTTQTWMKGSNVWYKGIIYNPTLVAAIEKLVALKKLPKHSIEASVKAIYDMQVGARKVLRMIGEAVAITTTPSCFECGMTHSKVTSTVRLAGGEATQLGLGGGHELSDREVMVPLYTGGPLLAETHLQNRTCERIKMSEEEEESTETEEAEEETTLKLAGSKTWLEMSPEERRAAAKSIGLVEPPKTPVKTGPTPNELTKVAMACKASGLKPKETEKVLLGLTQKKQPALGININAIYEESPDVTELRTKLEESQNKLKEFETTKLEAELKVEVDAIKEIDKGFDGKVFFEKIECPTEKIALAKRYRAQLERMKKPVSVQGISESAITNLERISMEAFGATPDGLLKEIVPEAFPSVNA